MTLQSLDSNGIHFFTFSTELFLPFHNTCGRRQHFLGNDVVSEPSAARKTNNNQRQRTLRFLSRSKVVVQVGSSCLCVCVTSGNAQVGQVTTVFTFHLYFPSVLCIILKSNHKSVGKQL